MMDLAQAINDDELKSLAQLVALRSEQLSAASVMLVGAAGTLNDRLLYRHQARLYGAGAVNDSSFKQREY